jgi:hypothetical protein
MSANRVDPPMTQGLRHEGSVEIPHRRRAGGFITDLLSAACALCTGRVDTRFARRSPLECAVLQLASTFGESLRPQRDGGGRGLSAASRYITNP